MCEPATTRHIQSDAASMPCASVALLCSPAGMLHIVFFFSSRRRHTRCSRDWSSDVCSSDLSYSPQDGTRATQYPDDVPDAVKRERLEELLEVQRAISAERLARFVGREVRVLVDRVADPDEERATHVGRVAWQADDVDGVTYVERGGWAESGCFLRARLTASEDYDFRAVALT